MREIEVKIEQAPEGDWWISCDEITGFYACGDTKEEALDNVKEAISMYLDLEPGSYRLKITENRVAENGSG